jgi:hypothetical protein
LLGGKIVKLQTLVLAGICALAASTNAMAGGHGGMGHGWGHDSHQNAFHGGHHFVGNHYSNYVSYSGGGGGGGFIYDEGNTTVIIIEDRRLRPPVYFLPPPAYVDYANVMMPRPRCCPCR